MSLAIPHKIYGDSQIFVAKARSEKMLIPCGYGVEYLSQVDDKKFSRLPIIPEKTINRRNHTRLLFIA